MKNQEHLNIATVGYKCRVRKFYFNTDLLLELTSACFAKLLLFCSLPAFEKLDLVIRKNRVYFVYYLKYSLFCSHNKLSVC